MKDLFSIYIGIKSKGGFILANYVKFVRGPLSAYDALQTKDNNTLYFITDGTGQDQKTLLYIGDSLVSDSSASLSTVAQDFLEKISDTSNLNDGDLQIWVGAKDILVVDPETGEPILDPETEEPQYTHIEPHWETVSITEAIPEFEGGTPGLVPQAPQTDRDKKYLNAEGNWVNLDETVVQAAISAIMGEGELDESFDTLKEISDWILNHPAGVAEINSRLSNIENALGFEYEEVPIQAKDEESEDGLAWEKDEYGEYILDENNEKIPIYETQPVQAKDEESEDGLAWEKDEYGEYILDENNEKIPIYETEESILVDNQGNPILDENNNPIIEEVIKTEVLTEKILLNESTNKINELQTITNNLLNLLEYVPATSSTSSELNRILNLEQQVSSINHLLQENENGELDFIIPRSVGNLEDLLMVQEAEAEGEEGPESLVEAINILDARIRWQQLNNN